MSNRNEKLDEEMVGAEASQRLRALRDIRPRDRVHSQALAKMIAARETGQSRKRMRWWQRRVAVPVPALGLLLILLFGAGWKVLISESEPTRFSQNAPVRMTLDKSVMTNQLSKIPSEEEPMISEDSVSADRQEIAVYIPTVGFVSSQVTNTFKREKTNE